MRGLEILKKQPRITMAMAIIIIIDCLHCYPQPPPQTQPYPTQHLPQHQIPTRSSGLAKVRPKLILPKASNTASGIIVIIDLDPTARTILII
jgi:hypothetical protein